MNNYPSRENRIRWPVRERSFAGTTLPQIIFLLNSTTDLKESVESYDLYTTNLYSAAVFLATQARSDDVDQIARQNFCLAVIDTLIENGIFPVLKQKSAPSWTPLKKVAASAEDSVADLGFFLELAEKLHHAGASLPPYSFCRGLGNEKLRMWFLERCVLQEKTNLLVSIDEMEPIEKNSVVKKKRFF